jgi:microsomal dipeptidase-like Zn-dependent dipeptidase
MVLAIVAQETVGEVEPDQPIALPHGYDDESLRKLAHENWIRVLRKTWK